MDPNQLHEDSALMKYLSDFVNNPLFLIVKDAFTCHVPAGESECVNAQTSDPIQIAHGKYLGTRYVFNKMESIRDAGRKPKPPKKVQGGKDPDLAE